MKLFELLTKNQRENIRKWNYSCEDPSITTKLFSPWWNWIVTKVPNYVAPNVLTISGLIMTLYAYFLCHNYFDQYPKLISIVSAILLFTYQTLDAIDGKHARRTRNDSPLGELFDHACDCVGTMFIALIICRILHITDTKLLFYIVQSAQLLFLLEHLKALKNGVVVFHKFCGPGEILLGCISLLLLRGLGLVLIPNSVINSCVVWYMITTTYYVIYAWTLFKVHTLSGPTLSGREYYGTKWGLTFCLIIRHATAVLIYFGLLTEISLLEVISQSLVLSVVTSDLIVAKMAKRNLHPTIVVGSLLTLFNHDLFTFILVGVYFLKVFKELCEELNIYLFTPMKTAYVCGVFDATHYGHFNHFAEVLRVTEANRLVVGIHSDEVCADYKRVPLLKLKERCAAVLACRYVSDVIPAADLVVTDELIKENRIHVVGCSTEYAEGDDEYYAAPRKMGILKVIPRVKGISTSEIIRRAKNSPSKND